MSSDSSESYETAAARVDKAVARLEASLRGLNGRIRSVNRIEADIQKLEDDRGQLVGELRRATNRAQKLDDSAAEVSRRLVTAMEQVRTIMAEEERS